MMHWLSRRHPRYIRSLVYMLQASEYVITDFLRWHHNVSDFRKVEQRKRLTFTAKAIFLFFFAWTVASLVVVSAFLLLLYSASPWNYILFAILLLELPLIVLGAVLLAVWKLQLLQGIYESFALARTRRALASHSGVKIAIAGSYGKTSTREILKTTFSAGKKVAAPKDSYNTPLGIAKFVQGLAGDEDVLIFEIGEYYPGDVRKLARVIKPTWGVITGVNEAHLEKFGTLERTANTIFELADSVPAAHLYVNGDSELARAHAKPGNIVYTRDGIMPPASGPRIMQAKTDLHGTIFKLKKDNSVFDVKSGLLGLHMLAPLALAADLGARLGMSDGEIITGLSKTRAFAHRLEPKPWGDGVTFLDDSYNGNPDGVRAAIRFLLPLKNRRFYVTPGLVEAGIRKMEVHEEIGRELAGAGIEKVVLIKNSVTPYIAAGLKSAGFKGDLLWYDSMPACISALRSATLPGDVVLIQNDWPDQYR